VTGKQMRFQLVFVHRDETGLSQEIVFLSEMIPATRPLR
jgi:hypothetical protein